jgi:hypothetical protein
MVREFEPSVGVTFAFFVLLFLITFIAMGPVGRVQARQARANPSFLDPDGYRLKLEEIP